MDIKTLIKLLIAAAAFIGGFSYEASASLKLMSFNIRYNTGKDTGALNWDVRKYAVQELVNAEKPDIVGLNEAKGRMRADIEELLPDYGMIVIPGTLDGNGANVAILYRRATVKLLKHDWFFHSATPKEPSSCWNVTSKKWRGTVWGLFKEKSTGKKFYYFCTHLCLGQKPCDLEGKLNSSLLNLTMMQKEAGNNATVFLAGDMNASYNENDQRRWGLQPYYWWMTDARTAPVTSHAPTFNGFGKINAGDNHVIDHIFYRNADVKEFILLDKPVYGVPYVSDHYPIMITAELPEK